MCVCVFSLSCCCWSLSLYYKFNLQAGNDSGEYRSQAVQSLRGKRERARPAQLKAVDQRIRAGTDAIRHLSNDAGRFPHQSAQVSPPARLEPSDSSGRSRKRAEGKKKEKHAIQWFRERARNCTHKSFDDELLETLFSFDRAPCGLDVDK